MSLVPARNGANAPPPRAQNLVVDKLKTSTKGRVPTGYAEEIVLSDQSFKNLHREVQSQQAAGRKRKRETKGDSSVVYGASSYKGPWAKFEEQRPDSDSGEEIEVEVSGDESGEEVVEYEEDAIAAQPSRGSLAGTGYDQLSADRETTVFEGSQQYDYQGRTYMHVPQDLDVDLTSDFENLSLKCYHPKKAIHTYTSRDGAPAHARPVTALQYFPGAGHILLSAGADGKVKLWDAYHARELLRTYSGHAGKAVVDVDFSPDGSRFLTGGYDRQMKVWDTETGACTARFSTGATPHVLRWHPDDRSGKEFLAGMHDNKIVQFDTRAPSNGDANNATSSSSAATTDRSKPVQEYDHHLGPINTITFVDSNRRFITTSDDKSLRAWEYQIPVPIKFIADPSMFALTRSAPHPNHTAVLYQSADNSIKVYSAGAEGSKIRANRKKEFKGHNGAGYALGVAVSPDGGIVASGDSLGWVCFWDWKTCKLWHKLRAGDSAVAAVAWHPRESSKVVTGDLDGVIKYWD